MRVSACIGALCVSLFVTAVQAQETINQASAKASPMNSANLMQWMGGLSLVLALILAAAWLVKRYGHFNTAHAGQLRVMGGLSVGTREKVVLLKAGERHLLLGVAPNQVSTLHVFEAGEIEDQATGNIKDFGENFRQAMRRGSTE